MLATKRKAKIGKKKEILQLIFGGSKKSPYLCKANQRNLKLGIKKAI